ncbi:MAG: hypothetical protein H6955_07525 [Chromatiaceae bacterium]|nr:hypothetical protein [Gammaproteobacteria bacterium]MCP5313390.1 hypothetical protein [Chromatiaceae bacterium]
MKSTILRRSPITCAVGLVAMLSAGGVFAASSVPVTVINSDINPVPVTSARQPYQLVFDVSASPGSVEACDIIPVPAGTTLTITSIGMDVRVDPSFGPSAYLRVIRGGTLFRYQGDLRFINQLTTRRYQGIYQLETFVGELDSGASNSAQICVAAPPAPTPLGSSARGVISGYVEPVTVIDGNALP